MLNFLALAFDQLANVSDPTRYRDQSGTRRRIEPRPAPLGGVGTAADHNSNPRSGVVLGAAAGSDPARASMGLVRGLGY
jgi:hypothetical protein